MVMSPYRPSTHLWRWLYSQGNSEKWTWRYGNAEEFGLHLHIFYPAKGRSGNQLISIITRVSTDVSYHRWRCYRWNYSQSTSKPQISAIWIDIFYNWRSNGILFPSNNRWLDFGSLGLSQSPPRINSLHSSQLRNRKQGCVLFNAEYVRHWETFTTDDRVGVESSEDARAISWRSGVLCIHRYLGPSFWHSIERNWADPSIDTRTTAANGWFSE